MGHESSVDKSCALKNRVTITIVMMTVLFCSACATQVEPPSPPFASFGTAEVHPLAPEDLQAPPGLTDVQRKCFPRVDVGECAHWPSWLAVTVHDLYSEGELSIDWAVEIARVVTLPSFDADRARDLYLLALLYRGGTDPWNRVMSHLRIRLSGQYPVEVKRDMADAMEAAFVEYHNENRKIIGRSRDAGGLDVFGSYVRLYSAYAAGWAAATTEHPDETARSAAPIRAAEGVRERNKLTDQLLGRTSVADGRRAELNALLAAIEESFCEDRTPWTCVQP